MRFAYAINDDQMQPDIAIGFLEADDAADALRQLRDPRANVYPLPDEPVLARSDGSLTLK